MLKGILEENTKYTFEKNIFYLESSDTCLYIDISIIDKFILKCFFITIIWI